MNPFGGCAALTEIVVESSNPVYDSRNGCNAIIKTDWNEMITGCQNTVIPDDVTRIGDDAFYFCSTLSGELVIPEQITYRCVCIRGLYRTDRLLGHSQYGESTRRIGFCQLYGF